MSSEKLEVKSEKSEVRSEKDEKGRLCCEVIFISSIVVKQSFL